MEKVSFEYMEWKRGVMHSESDDDDNDDDDVSKLRRQWQGIIIHTFRRRPLFRLSSTVL